MKPYIRLSIIASLIFAGFSQAVTITKHTNVAYCMGVEHNITLRMSIYHPSSGGPYPAIVLIHGGGWSTGSRTEYNQELTRAASMKGYVGVSVDYRLSGAPSSDGPYNDAFQISAPTAPYAVHDVKCAIRFLRSNALAYKIDPSKIAVRGDSAGGHLTLMLAVTNPSHGLEGNGGYQGVSSAIQAAFAWASTSDMVDNYNNGTNGSRQGISQFIGGTPAQYPDMYAAMSPNGYVSDITAPLLPPIKNEKGSLDTRAPLVNQTYDLHNALNFFGVINELFVRAGVGHTSGKYGDSLYEAITSDMYAWFDQFLK